MGFDATKDDVLASVGIGVGVAEFPTAIEAASECNTNNISVMMGAPNLLRVGSHSVNVAAQRRQ